MKYLYLYLFLKLCLVAGNLAYSQTITNGDGTALTTKYCYADDSFEIAGQPSGGVFSGCGIIQDNGKWYFNPVRAAGNVTVFPYQCALQYTVNGQQVSKNILVQKPVLIYPPLRDSATCNGYLQVHAATLYAGAYQYQWTPAAPLDRSDTSYSKGYITATQTFTVRATDQSSGCSGSDTITIALRPVPQVEAGPDITIKARETVQLQASGASSYQWSPALWLDNPRRADPVTRPEAPLTYTVTGTNEFGCRDTASVRIHINEPLFVPNAFSPNGDGLNDLFRIENYGYQEVRAFSVFNRWGKEVFHTLNGMHGWDGTYNGQPAEAGTYYYHIELWQREGTSKVFRGEVQLLR